MRDKRTALLIMAAGIGSRYGGGIKQLATVDDGNHIIMDYSIHDAIAAGFNQIVFILREEIEEDFMNIIGRRIEEVCRRHQVEVAYCNQRMEDIPGQVPEGRKKPWGTGQAVLAARGVVDTPFAVINADDYYGKEAFVLLHDWLCAHDQDKNHYAMAGFVLKNTLSENGGVTRGICAVDEAGYLTDVKETPNIIKTEGGAEAEGRVLDPEAYVSMNMWGLTPGFMTTLEKNFRHFFETTVPEHPQKAEYLLPILIGALLERQEVRVQVLPTADRWFGVTYQEDRQTVVENFRQLIRDGSYRADLFSDLGKH